jgi:O-methyltransferase involved in polyketide biosynthesis
MAAMTDRFDSGVAHPARRYNYWLGGKDNFAADRESGDLLAKSYPAARIAARANRAFLGRAVGYAAGEAGVRQFLDIGTGLPTADNTHEVAQRVAPDSRIVYVDNDPMVMAHARALLTSTPEGETRYLEDDLRHPEQILAAADILDFTRPVALILVAVVHFLPEQEESRRIVRTLVDALPAGSHLIMTAATTDLLTPELKANWDESLRTGRSDVYPRTRDEFASFFDGLELVTPGIVPVADWRPDPAAEEHPSPVEASIFGAVGRKI